jgi:hypothetical protein
MYSQHPPSGEPDRHSIGHQPSEGALVPAHNPLAEFRFSSQELRDLQKRLHADPFDFDTPHPHAETDVAQTLDTYTNGAFVGEHRQYQELDAAGNATGTIVSLNSNAHSSWVIDAANGLMGIISPGLGRLVEKQATQEVVQDILQKLGTDKIIRRFCHSQGAIIESNALYYLKERLSESEWERLTAKLEVFAFGPAILEWPRGVDVRAYTFDADPCPTIITVADTLFRPMQWFRDSQRVMPVVVPLEGDYTWFQAHSLPRYMNHLHRFFITDLAPDGAESFATELSEMMHEKRFADHIFNNVLDSVFERTEKVLDKFDIQRFCQILSSQANNGKIGFYTPEARVLNSLHLFATYGANE